jgi:hypothetical protein
MAPRRAPSVERADGENLVSIGTREPKLTRLKKILYPAAVVTKAEIIDYYVRVAPVLLFHLAERPIALKRYPDGVTGRAYWDKDAPSFKQTGCARSRSRGVPDANRFTTSSSMNRRHGKRQIRCCFRRKPRWSELQKSAICSSRCSQSGSEYRLRRSRA